MKIVHGLHSFVFTFFSEARINSFNSFSKEEMAVLLLGVVWMPVFPFFKKISFGFFFWFLFWFFFWGGEGVLFTFPRLYAKKKWWLRHPKEAYQSSSHLSHRRTFSNWRAQPSSKVSWLKIVDHVLLICFHLSHSGIPNEYHGHVGTLNRLYENLLRNNLTEAQVSKLHLFGCFLDNTIEPTVTF